MSFQAEPACKGAVSSSWVYLGVETVLPMVSSYPSSCSGPELLSKRRGAGSANLGEAEGHEDGSPFTKEDFKAQEVAVRPFACEIAAKMHPDLWTYHYDADNQRAATVTPPAVDFGRPSQASAGATTSLGRLCQLLLLRLLHELV